MLVIPQSIDETLLRQARAEAPLGACGLLSGVGSRVPIEITDKDAT